MYFSLGATELSVFEFFIGMHGFETGECTTTVAYKMHSVSCWTLTDEYVVILKMT